MKKIDHLALDGHALHLFLTVLDAGSVTAAADRLGLTQSAVSHALQRLTRIVGAPLFVKSGRGIVATAQAHRLAGDARRLIDQIEAFATPETFEPSRAELRLTIAANDFQAGLLLPPVYHALASQAAKVELNVIPSGSPTPDMLRDRRCDLVMSPYPPEATDILQRKLLEDRYAVFFDPACRTGPATQSAYLAARHVTIVHADAGRLAFDKTLEDVGIHRDIAVRAAGFAGIPGFLRGTDMLATVPSLLANGVMRAFSMAPLPGDGRLTRALGALPMFMAWHLRDQLDPAHVWLRQIVGEVAQRIAAGR